MKTRGLILLMLLFAGPLFAESLPQEAESTLLKGDWADVLTVLEKTELKDADASCRMVAAHACLATNRNNASLLMFLSVKEQKDIEMWSQWTQSLLQSHPENPVALYLSADADARQGKMEKAIEGFTKAIEAKKDFSLAMNARGVLRVLNNEWDEASMDFLNAIQCDQKLADAHANMGTYWVIRESAQGAIESFDKAISINPEFALAYNGIGCAYFGKGDFEKAAHNFSVAGQLSPVLVMAEINQGYASTYAAQLVTLTNAEKKPGTTLKSIMQQNSDTQKEQQSQLLKILPNKTDHEFWKKMDALPWILRSEEKTQALVNEYGIQKVQMGAFLKTQELKSNISQTNERVQDLHGKLNSYDSKIWNLQVAETVTSLGFSAVGTTKDIQKGWEIATLKTELRAEKGMLSQIVPNRNVKAVVDAVPLGLNPVSLAGSTASSGFKIGKAVLEDKRDATKIEFEYLASQVPTLGAQLRSIETNLDKLNRVSAAQPTVKTAVSQIPGYYTSMDRPLTEVGAIASMVDKSISKPTDGSMRCALVVGENSFRTNIQQQELQRCGFATKLIPPTMDIQVEAKKCGADVIVGIKNTTRMELPQIGRTPADGRTMYDDITKKAPMPPFPPGGGGGGAAVAPMSSRPAVQQNWDWGKQYNPSYPKDSPGGISTEELASSFVDKGNWPVLTSFGLLYQTNTLTEKEGEESK